MNIDKLDKMNIHRSNINTEEVESVLLDQPAVSEVAVTHDKGKYGERLVAWIVFKPQKDAEITELRQHIEKKLPAHMIPSVFIFLKHLALDANGKVDRKALSFYADESISNENYEGPRNLLERILTDIWKSILGEERIGIHDDFLDLGGDSIQAGLISLKIREYFRIEIPLAMFFEDLTVTKTAEEVYSCQKNNILASSDKIHPIDRNGDLPLSLFQENRLRYELTLDVNNVQYLHSSSWFSIRLSGNLDRESLENAFDYVINRHEVLRTAFWPVMGSVYSDTNKWNTVCQSCSINPGQFLPKVKFKQSIYSSATMNLNYYDISKYSTEDKFIEVSIIADEIIQKRYIYESSPLTRAALIRDTETEYILIVAVAHLIADGFSMRIYEKELAHVYNTLVGKHSINLPYIEIQYVDYVAWQKRQLETGSLDSVKLYWKRQLEGYTPIDASILPFTDIAGSQNDIDFDTEAKYFHHPISEELNMIVRKYASSVNMTIFSIAMTGFILCLHKESGKDDIGVSTFFANRTRPETENVIGMFATGNIIRTKININDSLYQCTAAVSENLNCALKNQEIMIELPDSRVRKSLYDIVVHRPITCELLIDDECAAFYKLDVEKVFVGRNKSEYALRSFIVDSSKKLSIIFQYNLDLFDGADIRRIAVRTENIIKMLVTNPSKKISFVTL